MQLSALEGDIYSLETNFAGKNETNRAIFDVSTNEGSFELEITSLDAHINLIKNDCQINVFGRKGSVLDDHNSNKPWSILVNGTIACFPIFFVSNGTMTPIRLTLTRWR